MKSDSSKPRGNVDAREQAPLDLRDSTNGDDDHSRRVPPQRVPHEERHQARS